MNMDIIIRIKKLRSDCHSLSQFSISGLRKKSNSNPTDCLAINQGIQNLLNCIDHNSALF